MRNSIKILLIGYCPSQPATLSSAQAQTGVKFFSSLIILFKLNPVIFVCVKRKEMALQTEPPLPPRYHKVVCKFMLGLRQTEIAVELKLSLNTVHTYMQTIYEITELRSPGRLHNWALQHGYTIQGGWTPYEA